MHGPLKRGEKVCTGRRPQKVKQDICHTPEKPFNRFLNLYTESIISGSSELKHKQKSSLELERNARDSHIKLEVSQPAGSRTLITAQPKEAVAETQKIQPERSSPEMVVSRGFRNSPSNTGTGPLSEVTITNDQSLHGVVVSGEEIDDMFKLFFSDFAPFLPILDPKIQPDTYYALSPFLFWCIIGISSRAYARRQNLLAVLGRRILEMAFLSVLSTSPPWHTIRGILLLLTWPFPQGNRPDGMFELGGILVHFAFQNNMHLPISGRVILCSRETYSTRKISVGSPELWVHTLIAYQRVCFMNGQLPETLISFSQGLTQHLEAVPSWMRLKFRCQSLIFRCSKAALDNGVSDMSITQERNLDTMLRVFESLVDDLKMQAVTDDERLDTSLCCMMIQSFHFFKGQTLVSSAFYPRILATASDLVDQVESFADRLGCLAVCPVHVAFGLCLASVSLLRVVKCRTTTYALDIPCAQSSLSSAMKMVKQMSVNGDDLAAKIAHVITFLENSKRAFRTADGNEETSLLTRDRLTFGLIQDAIFWWSEEFCSTSKAGKSAKGFPC